MKQDLHLSIEQNLIMTPRMQQAVKILQMSSQQLQETVEEAYNENPVLEFAESKDADNSNTAQENFNDLQNFFNYLKRSSGAYQSTTSHKGYDFTTLPSPPQNLADLLYEQAGTAFHKKEDRILARYIIGCIDERGYLTASIDELSALTNTASSYLSKILHIIQTFEPIGVGARDLQECLRLQAANFSCYSGLVATIIDKYLSNLAKNQLKLIAKEENCSLAKVQEAVSIIKTFTPKPGAAYHNGKVENIVPDVIVRKIDHEYKVFINDYTVPTLKISNFYRNSSIFDNATKQYIKKHINSALWLIDSINQRKQTLYNVVIQIIHCQLAFFDNGPDYLRPLTMQSISHSLGIHESTVSRAIANKYMQTAYGTIRIRQFFTANITTTTGEELADRQIKQIIRDLINKEDPFKPLSDQKICNILKQHDIDIARRTVMKYREQLGFLSSTNRRHYK